ncbi:MAG: c-type cytochrome [Rubripirellula sp.]|nr:c-type cytochrome [Rubripirellula sp.]
MNRSLLAWMVLVISTTAVLGDDLPEIYDTQAIHERLRTPAEALAAIDLPDGFKATLFAAEPDIRQPIALTTDHRGRLWVVENYTYAERETNFDTATQRDRILIFEDVDGDGQFDKRTVFWDQGKKVTSVEVGFGGIWVLAAPELLFIPDRDGDDQPDGEPEVILDGWDDDRVRHNIVNGLSWGPDGWLYGRHGIQATSLVGSPETPPEHRVQMECAIWRYHPTRRQVEVVARGTTNPWGMDWDQHGQLFFINTVIGHLWHVVPGSYYQRMYGDHFDPHVYQLLPQTADHFHWDVSEESWHDTKRNGVTSGTDKAGGGHAHQGMMIYAGNNWPDQYRGQLFTFNFHGRRINVERLERHGATYRGRHENDFMKSGDPWFRGIEMVCGPDGGVYIADWSDIGECHENDGIHRSSGRLFKIVYGETKPESHDLSKLTSVELVKLLDHRNEWFSRHARRLLQERAVTENNNSGPFMTDQELAEVIAQLRRDFQTSDALTHRLRVMWALYAVGAANETWLINCLSDPNEHVRCWAVQLLIDQGSPTSQARNALESLATKEDSGLVLSFLASALHRLPHQHRWVLATHLASHHKFASDSHYPLFVWYGIQPAVAGYPKQAVRLADSSRLPLLRQHLARRLTEEIDHQPQAVNELVKLISDDRTAAAGDILRGMHAALQGRSQVTAPSDWARVESAFASPSTDANELVRDLSVVFGSGRALKDLLELVKSDGTPIDVRRRSIQALVTARTEGFATTLQQLLPKRYINVEAIRGLAAYRDPETAKLLLKHFDRFYQPAKTEAISTLVSRPEYCSVLLDAIQSGTIERNEVSPFQIRQIQLFGKQELNTQISRLWPELQQIPAQKQKQIANYKSLLTAEVLLQADLSEGRLLFKQHCGKCHKLFNDGETVGPPLTGTQRNQLDYLLENIVDPSATVSKDYQLSIVLTDDGRVLNGVLLAQNERTITLRTTDQRLVLSRDQIEMIRESALSLMPDQQLDLMTPDQVRDLIAYLMSPSQVPLP